jgi:hypothetical protein
VGEAKRRRRSGGRKGCRLDGKIPGSGGKALGHDLVIDGDELAPGLDALSGVVEPAVAKLAEGIVEQREFRRHF